MSNSTPSESGSSSLDLLAKSRLIESDTEYLEEDVITPQRMDLPWSVGTAADQPALLCAAWALTLSRSYEVSKVEFGVDMPLDLEEGHRCKTVSLNVEIEGTIEALLLRVSAILDKAMATSSGQQTPPIFEQISTASNGTVPTSTLSISRPSETMGDLVTDMNIVFGEKVTRLIARPGSLRRFEIQSSILLSRFRTAMEQLQLLKHSTELQLIPLQSLQENRAILDIYGPLEESVEDCVHNLIARQAQANPRAIAISAWDGELTYSEMDALSTKLAHHLVSLSVEVDDKVALCFEKSLWAIVSMLAIIKAGAAGFALSTTNPVERTRTMMQQTDARIILSDRQRATQLAGFAPTIVTVDSLLMSSLTDDPRPLPEITSENVAYIIFTSGSTGKPKAIVTEHGSLCSSLHAHGQRWMIQPGTRVFNFAAYTFDISIADIFFTLALGATVCVPSETERVNDLAGAITKYQANWAFLTPTVTDTLDPASVPTLKNIFWSGEASTKPLVQRWASEVNATVSYGPAEASVHCAGSMPKRMNGDHQNVGRSLGCRMWIMDQNHPDRQALVGTVGEVAIEGRIIARGYLGDPVKTNQSFVWTRAFTSEPIRVYKTGDMGRLNWDGTVSIVGRIDSQVKIRGQRVELGEIEQQFLKSFPGVDAAVAWASTTSGSTHTLVMFFTELAKDKVGHGAHSHVLDADPALLDRLSISQQRLRDYLPSYMIPSLFVPLSEIPLTSHGKTDRKALSQILSSLSSEHTRLFSLMQGEGLAKRQPQTDLEVKLHQLLVRQLGLAGSAVSVDEDFFRLGGNSLTAIKMCAAARDVNVRLTVATIMEHPTVEKMARAISEDDDLPTESNGPLKPPRPFELLRHSGSVDAICQHLARQCHVPGEMLQNAYPCTPMQRSLFLQSLKSPGSYVVEYSWSLEKTTDTTRFKSAWEKVVAACDVVRTRIVEGTDGSLWQAVIREDVQWHTTRSDATSPMALGTPLFGFTFQETDEHRRFVLEAHHAVVDGWALTLLLDEFEAAYQGSKPGPILQFQHFVQDVATDSRQDHDDFWRDQLDSFAYKSPIDTVKGQTGVVKDHVVIESRNLAFTHFDYLRAAWAIVMSSYERTNDVVLGVVESGRDSPLPGIEMVVGPTLTTVPVRTKLQDDELVTTFLQSVRSQRAAMMPHRQVGLSEIAKLSPGARAACDLRNILVVQPPASPDDQVRLLSCQHMDVDIQLGDCGLVLECQLADNAVELNLEHDLALLSKSEAEQMLSQFVSVFGQLQSASATTCLTDLCLLSQSDKTQIMDWNSRLPKQVNVCIQRLFAAQVERSPKAQAVEAWDGVMDFQQLDEASSRLAAHLAHLGVGPGYNVPVCFEKSLWFVVGVMAVLKTGAAFIPLDSLQPTQRLNEILHIVSAKYCLVSAQTRTLLSADECALVEVPAALESDNPISRNLEHDDSTSLAYMVFTSGSTGKPKGVMIEHRSFTSGAIARAPLIHRNQDSRVFAFSSHSFDTTIEDVLTTLIVGGCICIPSENERKNDLSGAINRYRANTFDTAPSIITLVEPSSAPTVETLILGGEAVTAENVALWSAQTTLLNTFGPCECAIVSTVSHLASPDATSNNIGRGVGCLTWVVDETNHNRLVPIGAVGELLLEGPIVGRGYLDNEQQTKKAFLESTSWRPTFDLGESWRMYKTGDLVRYAPDGSLIFLGRKDSQVKIRGQRVEPGEIEDKLRMVIHEHDTKVVVETVQLSGRPPLVVAFLSNATRKLERSPQLLNAGLLPSDLSKVEAELSAKIPSYMMPAYYVRLDTFPRTSTEKVDRKTLRGVFESLVQSTVPKSDEHEMPTKERPTHFAGIALQALWAEVLRLTPSRIGLEDNFFVLGGDSVGAMQLVASCKKSGMPLTVTDVFKSPSLGAMADQVISQMKSTSTDTEHSPNPTRFSMVHGSLVETVLETISTSHGITAESVQDMYPCSPLQDAFMRGTLQSPGAYIASHVFSVGSAMDLNALKAAWASVVTDNDILRTRIVETESGNMLQVVLDEPVKWQHAESLEDCFNTAEQMGVGFGSRLSSFTLIEKPAACLVWTAHHSVYDGWALEILRGALQSACDGRRKDTAPYSDYIRHIGGIDMAAAADAWKATLAHPPESNRIGSESSPNVIRQEQTLTSTLPCAMPSKSALLSSSFINVAWALTISPYLETEDVIFGSVSSGRNVAVSDILTVVGPTMSTFPMRISIDQDESVQSLLERVQKRNTETMPFQQFGMQHIRELDDDCRRACQFETLLDIHPAEETAHAEEDVTVSSSRTTTSAFHTHPLVITCRPSQSDVFVEFVYDAQVIEPAMAQRMMNQFQHVLRQVVECKNVSTKVADLELVSPLDRAQLMAWNAADYVEVHDCIHDRVHEQAVARPDAMAVEGWDASFTYKKLDDLSTRLAGRLVSLGVGEKPIIPLCFTKSAWTVVAMLAVLKTGGSYVALDASHPHNRLRVMVEQTRAQTMVLAAEFKPVFESDVKHVVVLDDALADELLALSETPRLPIVQPTDPAFLCFTSGSTGLPKAVILNHYGFCTLAAYVGKDMDFSPRSRVLQFAAYAFDVSNAETFLTLLHGGTLFVASDYDRMNNIVGVLKRWQINWLFLTPTFAATVTAEDIEGVETFTMGGEAPRQDLIDRFAHRVRLWNAYGPAETTIWPTITRFHPDSDPKSVGVSGSGSHLWLVHPRNHHQLVPVGVTGEILIEGPMVGPGYLFNEAKTKAAFIKPPRWATPSADGKPRKFYKVGDLAVQKPDGSVSFVGRKDNQVKLRGQRLELGEVEHRIMSESESFAAAGADIVTIQQGDKNVQALAAFVRMSDGTGISFTDKTINLPMQLKDTLAGLRSSLMRHLPSYMVPSYYVPMRRFPTTASGKLDRRALREGFEGLAKADQLVFAFQSSSKRRPTTPNEARICSIWTDILHMGEDAIGMDDSPLQLGADSMAAIKASGLARKHGLDMPVAVILKASSMTQLCEAVTGLAPQESVETLYTPFSLLRSDDSAFSAGLKSTIATQCRLDESRVLDAYPLTKLQEGIALLSQKEKGAYVSQYQLMLPAAIDLEKFKKAWERVLTDCDILRSRLVFTDSHGVLQAVVNDELEWREADDLPLYLQHDRNEGFDYGDALSRYCIVSDATSRYFVWTAHHCVYDGWTVQRIPELLRSAYMDEVLPAQPPFRSFVKTVLDMDDQAAAKFWTEELSGFSAPDFGLTRTHLDCRHVAGRVTHTVARQHASHLAVTEPVVIQAAWGILLGQYYNSQDVIYGLTVSGRDPSIPSILEISGPTISTVPRRIRLADTQTVKELLQMLHDQSVASMAHDQYGLQMIQKCSEDAKAACSFETLLLIDAQDGTKRDDWTFGAEASTAIQDSGSFHAYPFVLSATLFEETTLLEAEFDAAKIPEALANNLLQQLEHIVQQLKAASPSTTVADINLLATSEHESLRLWNSDVVDLNDSETSLAIDSQSLVHAHIQNQTQSRPQTEAVFSSELVLSYEALNQATDRVAAHLQSLGLGPECFVPVCFEKSPYAIIAIVGIIKAGAAFVPIDPKHPASRIREILHQTKASHVAVSPTTKSTFDQGEITTIEVSSDSIANLAQGAPSTSSADQPGNPLYIIYTSGSTGKPKGVVTEHHAFCKGVMARSVAQQRSPRSRVLQFASYTFDMSIEDILATLMNGGTVCVPTEYQRINALGAFMAEARVNTAHLTPSTVSTINPEEVPSLDSLLLLGEAMTPDNVKVWSDRVTLINTYGPSEASVVSTVTGQVRANADPANIGVGYACNTWIVDPRCHDKLTPIGGIGELLLEGPILARHYLEQPDKTSAVFITDPKWARDKSGKPRRFYKTGDLCRYDLSGDGSLVFVGRKDTQIKLRGSRIELGEVETQLQRLLPYEQLAVDVVNVGGQEKRELAAFVVVQDPCQVTEAASPGILDSMSQRLRRTIDDIDKDLKASLPSVMIPTRWLPVHQIPLSSSGKRDRKALQTWARDMQHKATPAASAATTSQRRAPQGAEELLLGGLWAKVLSIDPDEIDIDDDFMSVGGDSIMAMRLAALARSKNISLTVADIFTHSRFRDMAAQCGDRSGDSDAKMDVAARKDYARNAELDNYIATQTAISPADIADVYPATDFQRWCVTTDQMKSRGWSNYWMMDFSTPVDRLRLVNALNEIANQHPILRTAFMFRSAQLLQIVRRQPLIDHDHFEDASNSKTSEAWISDDMHNDTVLTTGGLRLATWGSVNAVNKAIITLSHARFDALSLSLMNDDLIAAYDGKPIPHRPDFGLFIRHACSEEQQRKDENFWRELLQRSEMTKVVHRPEGHCYKSPVDKTHVQSIRNRSNNQPFTFATTLKAAWALTLAQHCGTTDVVFGHLVSGRTTSLDHIDKVVGPCINLIPVRASVNEESTHQSLLSAIQKQHVSAMPHENLGFDRIIQNCTNWAPSTRFSSIVQHQNVHEVDKASFANGTIDASVNLRCPPHDSTDVWVISIPQVDHIDVTLCCNESLIPDDVAQALLQRLVDNIQELSSADKAIEKPRLGPTGSIPTVSSDTQSVERSRELQLSAEVRDVWSRVLNVSVGSVHPSTPYFHLRGDMSAALLLLKEYRVLFTKDLAMEEIIESPTLQEHVELLLSRLLR